ncbi:DEAD/DEAH box helicase family protein [Methanobrevibacter sp.]|uniref:DEAD/DEAH box helicase family protein n=1 Tax=Methanobrevibacter sp. TaxID=66852 RepID=UPI003866BB15
MSSLNNFYSSPYDILDPESRWVPESIIRSEKDIPIPPLVHNLRVKVKEWRDSNYEGASSTSKALLSFWFEEEHWILDSDGRNRQFKYYFAQREAVETIIYLHEIANVEDKYGLLEFNSSKLVDESSFEETWSRFVVKMATGSGKTKVLSLILVWSFFHKTYEENSNLSRNFLVITPNIIVLDRIKSDFNGLKTFFKDPMVPDNGYYGHNWKSDFQLTVHIQDDVNMFNKIGNIFLTNIHRVFDSGNINPSFDDENTMNYFLGTKAVDGKEGHVDLGDIVRDIDELMILNDEAHHIHDSKLKWFKSIEDIHNNLKQKGKKLSMQVDFSATPKDQKGHIFPQTIVDYPLVEAIHQNIVKQPFIPDAEGRSQLQEKPYHEVELKYEDYLRAGYEDWKEAYNNHINAGKKAVLFVMVENTDDCDAVAEYLEETFPELNGAVLTIHTKNNGDFKDNKNKKDKQELEKLRKAANEIDSWNNPYKAIVSVLVLKEGWDVKNVTTIVGLRSYSAPSNILPEQTLGRGLRKMYDEGEERLMIIGTDPFMDFVQRIKSEGVILGECSLKPSVSSSSMLIEVDKDNENKDIGKLDIKIPVLQPSFHKDYVKLKSIDVSKFQRSHFEISQFDDNELKEIVFVHIMDDGRREKLIFDTDNDIDFRAMLRHFTNVIMKKSGLVSGNEIIYGKLKEYLSKYLFNKSVDLEDKHVVKTIASYNVSKFIVDVFVQNIIVITTVHVSEPKIINHIMVSDTTPFTVKPQEAIIPQKSIFNKIIGDSKFELKFAAKLESFNDIVSYSKIYYATQFYIQYQNINGDVARYFPDFLVKTYDDNVYVIETKGKADLDVPLKLRRLKKWCDDVNSQQEIRFTPLYVEQAKFESYSIHSFGELVDLFISELDYIIQ